MKRRILLLIPLAVGAIALSDSATAQYRNRKQAYIDYINSTHESAVSYRPTNYAPPVVEPQREERGNEPRLPVPGKPMSERQAYAFEREYDFRQSRGAMENALGRPDLTHWNEAKWKIRRVGINGREDGRYGYLRVKYDWRGRVTRRNFEW